MGELEKRTVLVTGAGDSVGRVIAETFADQGARVHICDIREDAVNKTLSENPEMSGSTCNVGSKPEVDRLFDEVSRNLGHVDVLVNCVGIAGPNVPLEAIKEDEWQSVLQINVTGMFYLMQKAIPGMKERRSGAIVNFSSSSTRSGLPNRTAYIVSKYAVEGLTRNAARELGPYNIRCNAVLPGAINNARLQEIFGRCANEAGVSIEEYEAEALRYISMRTKIELDELANAVWFLASDMAPHITGVLLEVSGGHEWEG